MNPSRSGAVRDGYWSSAADLVNPTTTGVKFHVDGGRVNRFVSAVDLTCQSDGDPQVIGGWTAGQDAISRRSSDGPTQITAHGDSSLVRGELIAELRLSGTAGTVDVTVSPEVVSGCAVLMRSFPVRWRMAVDAVLPEPVTRRSSDGRVTYNRIGDLITDLHAVIPIRCGSASLRRSEIVRQPVSRSTPATAASPDCRG